MKTLTRKMKTGSQLGTWIMLFLYPSIILAIVLVSIL
jgi:hypothetical protein